MFLHSSARCSIGIVLRQPRYARRVCAKDSLASRTTSEGEGRAGRAGSYWPPPHNRTPLQEYARPRSSVVAVVVVAVVVTAFVFAAAVLCLSCVYGCRCCCVAAVAAAAVVVAAAVVLVLAVVFLFVFFCCFCGLVCGTTHPAPTPTPTPSSPHPAAKPAKRAARYGRVAPGPRRARKRTCFFRPHGE
jgi:hypothetical protein